MTQKDTLDKVNKMAEKLYDGGFQFQIHRCADLYEQITEPFEDVSGADSCISYLNRGVIQKHLKRYEESLADFDTALRFREGITDSSFLLFLFRGEVKSKLGLDGIADFDSALTLRPDDYNTLGERARNNMGLGRWTEAIADYNKLEEVHPRLSDKGYHSVQKGEAMHQLGKLNDALVNFESARRGGVWSPYGHAGIGMVLMDLGKYPEAFDALDLAVGESPNNAKFRHLRGHCLLKLGQPLIAIMDLDKAIKYECENRDEYKKVYPGEIRQHQQRMALNHLYRAHAKQQSGQDATDDLAEANVLEQRVKE